MPIPNNYPSAPRPASPPMPTPVLSPSRPPVAPPVHALPPRVAVQPPHDPRLPITDSHRLRRQDTSGKIQSGAFITAQQAVPREKKPGIGKIILAVFTVCVVLALVCGGLVYLGLKLRSTATTPTPSTRPRATVFNNIPTNAQALPTAVAILSGAQTASAIDSNYQPTQVTQNFTAKQTVYFTFHIDSQRQPGYVEAKWYLDGKVINTDILAHNPQNDHGYFSLNYNVPGSGAAAMYWCTQPTCSDAQLAQVVTFFVNK